MQDMIHVQVHAAIPNLIYRSLFLTQGGPWTRSRQFCIWAEIRWPSEVSIHPRRPPGHHPAQYGGGR
jgi:hypothetical protein